jgi:hypothetical protein
LVGRGLFNHSIRLPEDPVHHPANVGKASAAVGILFGTIASTGLFSRRNPFHNQGTTVLNGIVGDIGFGIAEAVAYPILTGLSHTGLSFISNCVTTPSITILYSPGRFTMARAMRHRQSRRVEAAFRIRHPCYSDW